MKPFFLLLPILLSASLLCGQSTERDTLRPIKSRRFEIGLNITNTLGNFLGASTNFSTDPYLLSFRFGGPTHRVRTGLNFKVQDKTDPNTSGFLTEKETAVNLRAGYEWVYPMSRRLAMYWGLDGVFEHTKDKIKTFTGQGTTAVLNNRKWGLGAGPVLGVAWRPHPRVSITTECSIYAIYRRGSEQVFAPPDFSTEFIHDFVFQPLLPTSLFVNFSF